MAESPEARAAYAREVARWRAEHRLVPRGVAVAPQRCLHCHGQVVSEAGISPPPSCSERCRRAAQLRTRLGLPAGVMPGATREQLHVLVRLRDGAPRLSWAERVALAREGSVPGA